MSANTFLQGTARITAKNSDLIARTHRVAHEVAAVHAAAVDAENRFPSETFAALKREGLLSASVPKAFGGAGAGMAELAAQCATLAQGCGASGMVLAMHHIQVACMARHGADSPFFQAYLREIVEKQLLMASVTSEVGTWGDTRSSICAIEYAGD
nr:acyl-CoA dehydrogenase family protein [Kofleriaceae bacterium]